jgi:hypothetical protein
MPLPLAKSVEFLSLVIRTRTLTLKKLEQQLLRSKDGNGKRSCRNFGVGVPVTTIDPSPKRKPHDPADYGEGIVEVIDVSRDEPTMTVIYWDKSEGVGNWRPWFTNL